MINRFRFDEKSFVVEVASNDGYLLQYFKEKGIEVLGVEPTSNTAEVAIKKGIPTEIEFFNTEFAKQMLEQSRQADLIIGNNVLAHNPQLNDFVEGLKIALNSGGVITMEFPHLLKLIEKNEFDTVYHEHFSYFSFYTVKRLFEKHDLQIFDVDEISTHGGSLRIYAKHKLDTSKKISENIEQLLEKEKVFGLLELDTYTNFSDNVEQTKRNLLKFLIEAKEQYKAIAAYGAPAKGNTLLNYCGIRTDFIEYTVDRNPHKQNCFLPGVNIPVYHPDKIKETKPDYVLILPWNIKDEVLEQMKFVKEWGGKFVVPIPNLQVL
jgi:SAM-dependent methyltransferase